MGVTITLSKVKLVRESSHRYGEILSRNISEPEDAVKIINAVLHLDEEAQEVLAVLFLDTRNKVTGIMEVSRGSLTASIGTPREILKGAILHNACSFIILAHNHPSGDPTPSNEDIRLTKQMKNASELIGIPLLDHIILTENGGYMSLKDADLL